MYKLKRKEYLNENLFKIFFDKGDLTFLPGQHFSLSVPGKSINREYSSYTSIHDNEIGFLIRRIEGGIMTNILDKMEIGEYLNIYGPYGSFILSQDQIQNNKIIFIASGTGLAPFVSIKESYNLKNYILFLGIRNISDIPDADKFNQDHCYYCISRDSIINQNNYYKGRLTDQLLNIEYIDDYQNSIYMICGNSYMISDAYDILLSKKIDPNLIITESFF